MEASTTPPRAVTSVALPQWTSIEYNSAEVGFTVAWHADSGSPIPTSTPLARIATTSSRDKAIRSH
jgi:hypothetical protein